MEVISILDLLKRAGVSDVGATIESFAMPNPARWNPAPDYLVSLLHRSGRTASDCAEVIGIDPDDLHAYVSGKMQCPYAVQFCLEVLAALKAH